SYHTDFTNAGGNGNPNNPFRNPVTHRGPMEGRPPGEVFAHQRWNEFFPKVGYIMSIGQIAANTRFHPNFPAQNPNSVWTYGTGSNCNRVVPPRPRPYGSRRPAAILDQGAIRRADPHPHLPEPAGQPRRQSVRLRPQRDAVAFPQCAQWRRERRRRQHASLP